MYARMNIASATTCVYTHVAAIPEAGHLPLGTWSLSAPHSPGAGLPDTVVTAGYTPALPPKRGLRRAGVRTGFTHRTVLKELTQSMRTYQNHSQNRAKGFT